MIRICCGIIVLSFVVLAGNTYAQECAGKAAPAAQAKEKAAVEDAKSGATAVSSAPKKKIDEKSLMEIKRQIRLMREEMAQIEENIDRMTNSMREDDKGRTRE